MCSLPSTKRRGSRPRPFKVQEAWSESFEKGRKPNLLVLLINGAHKSCGRWEDLVHENEDGLFRRELDSLSDNVDELAHGQILCNSGLVYVPKGEYRGPTCTRNGARQPAAHLGAEQTQG